MAITGETESQKAIKYALAKERERLDFEKKQRVQEDRIKKNELRDAKAEPHWAQLDKLIEEKLIGASALKAYESWQTCMGNVLEAGWEMHYALKEAQPISRVAQSIINVPKEFNAKLGLSDAIKNAGRWGLSALYLVDPKLETLPNLRAMVKIDAKGKLGAHISAFKDGKELSLSGVDEKSGKVIPLSEPAQNMKAEIEFGVHLFLKSEGYNRDNNGVFKKAGATLTQAAFDDILANRGGLLADMLSDKTGLAVEPTASPRM